MEKRVPWKKNDTPWPLVNFGFQKEGLKGPLLFLFLGLLITIASVRMVRMTFLYTSLGNLCPLKVTESTCATDAHAHFLGSLCDAKVVWLGAMVLQKAK